MEQFRLNDKSKKSIEKKTGLAFEELISTDAETIDSIIEEKIGKKLKNKYKFGNYVARGSVYIYLKRLLNRKDIDSILSKI
ncbi:MAG: hypothetical protein KA273_05920 [Bacteroidales bacterium]|nr:hypothetical protein [Bacteroidales bacterium]